MTKRCPVKRITGIKASRIPGQIASRQTTVYVIDTINLDDACTLQRLHVDLAFDLSVVNDDMGCRKLL